MPEYSDVSSIQAQYARRMVQKYEVQQECSPLWFQVLSKCKYGFPFKVPQYTEELDDDGIMYRCRCKEDCIVKLTVSVLFRFHCSMTIYSIVQRPCLHLWSIQKLKIIKAHLSVCTRNEAMHALFVIMILATYVDRVVSHYISSQTNDFTLHKNCQ